MAALAAISAVVWNTTTAIQAFTLTLSPAFLWTVIFIVFIATLSSLSYKAHIKKTYDPTLVREFEKEFFYEMPKQRSRAAGVLLLYSKKQDWKAISNVSDIEPIFDFFDTIGFYFYGVQLSDRVIHQSFYHWIVLYYQTGNFYIKEARKGRDGENAVWEFVNPLVAAIVRIEAKKQNDCEVTQLTLTPEKYRKYLIDELGEDEEHFKRFSEQHPDLVKQLRSQITTKDLSSSKSDDVLPSQDKNRI